MHNAYFSSSIYCLRTKGYLSNDCSYLLNERFDRNPFHASSLLASASCCCDCCAFPTHRVVPISPCYLYGLRQSSLLQWSASRRLDFGGRDRYYSRVQECIPGRDCYEVSCCFRERSVYNRRGRRGNGKCCCNEEGKSEVYDSGDYGDVEAVLSLLSEEVGEECFGGERNVISFKRAELEGKKSLGGRQRNVSSSKRVEENSRRSLGGSKRNVTSLKRVEEENGRSLSGGTRNKSSLRRVEEEIRRNLSGGMRNVSSSRIVEEESRRHLSGSTRNVSSSKTAETERSSFDGREKVESSSKGVQVGFEGNDSGECYSWEKKSNGRRLSSFESNSKRQLESATVKLSERDSRHKEERGILSRGENHGVRKEGSSCSSYYSFSSSGDLGSEADVLDKHGLLEEPGSSVYKDSQYDRGGRSDERVSEEYKNYKDDAKGKREMSKQRTTAVEGGVMWDWGKKSEKKLTDAVIEETHASRKSSEMHSRVFKTNESELAKSSGSRKQSDDEKENSYLIKGTKERYSQTVNQDVGEIESRRKFQGGKEKVEIYRTDFGTTSLAQDRHSDREENIDVAINLVPETKEEHYKTTGYVTRAKDVNRDAQKFSGTSQVQVVDSERTSNLRRQSDTRIINHKESTSMGIGSVDETEAECYQIGHEIDQKARQKVQSRKGTNTVDETSLVHASDTATNTNSQRISMKRTINQDTVSAATLVEETRLRNTQTDENLMQVKSRKGAQSSTKVSSSHEKDPGETSSFQTTLSMVSQGRMQQHDVEGNKRTPEGLLMPPPSQLIARGPAYNEPSSETTTQEVSVETSESGSALNYDSGSGNANPETQGEILYLTNPEDALGSAHRSEESSSHFVGEFFNKVRQEVSTSENQNDNNEQRTSTLHQESSSGNGNNETPGKTFKLTNPEDALGSAHRLEKSSSQFSGEFSGKARQTASTSEEQRAEMVSETKLLLGGEKYGQRISSQYGSKDSQLNEDSQLKENNSKRSSGGSGTKGPSVEMWDVTDTSTLQSPKEEPKEEKLEATTSEKLEVTTTSGNAIAKRTGRSIWNIVADIVKLRWSSHNGTHCSTARSGEQISSNEYASSEAWFSGHEPDENSEKNVKWDKGTQPEATSDQLQPAKSLSPGVESLGPNDNQKNYQGSSSGIQVVESSQPLLASGMKSPLVEEISSAGNTVSGSGSVSDDVQKGGELKQRRFQRNKQVVKDRFDEWEEAHNLEIEQRKTDEMFMREALLEAKKAADTWEVPVGAVLVQHGKIIARGYNLVEELRDSTAHAEMICIREASNVLRTWRLSETTLYVTLEPCPMCAGAILQARVQTVVWGAPNKLLGADGSWIRLFPDGGRGDDLEHSDKPAAPVHPFHPNMTIRRGVLASECANTMQQFFQLRRKKKEKRQADTPAPPPTTTLQSSHHPSKILAKVHDIFHMMFCL